jgi:transposase-like protein
MDANDKEPKTLQKAIAYFSDPDQAFEYAVKLRWPDDKIVCPRCSSEKNSFVKTCRLWFCYGCKKQFTVKVKTIFEDSAISLDKWLVAISMLANCRNGVSSWELHRTISVTLKIGMVYALATSRGDEREHFWTRQLGGGPGSVIEADQTFIGGKIANMTR